MKKDELYKAISPHTENSIFFAIKYYHQYMQQCDNLAYEDMIATISLRINCSAFNKEYLKQ